MPAMTDQKDQCEHEVIRLQCAGVIYIEQKNVCGLY